MTVWNHAHKGRIEGEIVREFGDWMRIRLTGEHHLHYFFEANQGRVLKDGDQITVLRSLLAEEIRR